ncbi:unnamed protein product [Prunus armeniaca]
MLGCLAVTGLPSVSSTPFVDRVPNWSELLTVLGVGFPVGMGLRFLLDLGCLTCLEKDLGEFVLFVEERSHCASQGQLGEARFVVVVATAGSEQQPWWSRYMLERAWSHALQPASVEQVSGGSQMVCPYPGC